MCADSQKVNTFFERLDESQRNTLLRQLLHRMRYKEEIRFDIYGVPYFVDGESKLTELYEIEVAT